MNVTQSRPPELRERGQTPRDGRKGPIQSTRPIVEGNREEYNEINRRNPLCPPEKEYSGFVLDESPRPTRTSIWKGLLSTVRRDAVESRGPPNPTVPSIF